MNLDQGRRYDLEELYDLYQDAPHSKRRQQIEKMMSEIVHEDGASRELRDKMIKAMRANDLRAKRYFMEELLKLKQDKLYGRRF